MSRGMVAVCEDAALAAAAPVDVLFDASTAIEAATVFIPAAMAAGKHVVMMNAEADALLVRCSGRRRNVTASPTPVATATSPRCWRLTEELRFGGRAGDGGQREGFLDRYTDPIKIKPEADKRYLDAQMCSSYTDGPSVSKCRSSPTASVAALFAPG